MRAAAGFGVRAASCFLLSRGNLPALVEDADDWRDVRMVAIMKSRRDLVALVNRHVGQCAAQRTIQTVNRGSAARQWRNLQELARGDHVRGLRINGGIEKD